MCSYWVSIRCLTGNSQVENRRGTAFRVALPILDSRIPAIWVYLIRLFVTQTNRGHIDVEAGIVNV